MPIWAGFLLFLLLNGLAWVAASSLSVRARLDGPAETTLATFAGWVAIVTFPILVLGWTSELYAWKLALAVTFVSTVALFGSYRGVAVREHSRQIIDTFTAALALPSRGLRECIQRKSLVGVGVLASGLVIVYTAWLSYLAPSSGWDGIWYHETIVGFAIQNHSFRAVDIPLSLQNTNGFPRVCESMNLWFVIFTDRRFIEGVNSVMSVPLLLAMYVLARRYSSDRVLAMGWASALFLMPGMVLQLRSTYIDFHVVAILLIAVHFATRPRLRMRDAVYGAVYIGLLSGTKGIALVWAPVVGAVLTVRLASIHLRRRPLATLGAVGLMVLVVGIAAVPTYLQNWLLFHNPIWPVTFDSARFRIHWEGNHDIRNIDMNRPVAQMLHDILAVPVPGHDWPDTRASGYGLGLPFVVLPISIVALVAAIGSAIAGAKRGTRDRLAENVLLVAVPLLLTAKVSPALWAARYNLHLPAAMILLTHWLCGRRFWRIGEGAVVATIVTSLMMLWWADPGWMVSFSQALDLAAQAPEERATFPSAEYMMARETAAAREHDLGPGDVVAFTDTYMFPSLFWNDRFTNRVVYIPAQRTADEFVRRLDEARAKWVVVGMPSAESVALKANSRVWELVGEASHTAPLTVAFRRKRGN